MLLKDLVGEHQEVSVQQHVEVRRCALYLAR